MRRRALIQAALSAPAASGAGWRYVSRGLAGLGGALAAPLAAAVNRRGAAALRAQEPNPAFTLVASGLYNPRGMAWDGEGRLYVAQAGTGVSAESVGAAANVVRIEDGCGVPVVTGLPSTQGMSGAVQGTGAVAFLGGTLYLLQDSEDDRGDLAAAFPNGVYRATADGKPELVADITAWMIANPTKEIPRDRGKLGETFNMMAGDGFLWVVESNEGQVLKVFPDGRIERFVDLSEGHPVPTGIAPAPNGGVYVGDLTTTPYTDGTAKVWQVAADGTVETFWTGLTMIVGLAAGADGTLYALEMSTGNRTASPFVRPNAGRIVKRTGANRLVEVASRLDFPIAIAIGPDGGLSVSGPTHGSTGPAGWVIRVDPTAEFLSVPADLLAGGTCPGFAQAQAAVAAVNATMVAEENVPTPTPAPAVAGAVPVTIENFAFDPPTVNLRTGQSITWTNKDPVAHTATAMDVPKTFDSGNLNQGQSYSFTFDRPGTFDYLCIYHPYMKGTVLVSGEPVAAPAGEATAETTAAATESPAAPAATPTGSAGITVVASGLANPRGMAWGADGTLYVAQSGTGEAATSTGVAASVVRIEGGCPRPVATGLPSTRDPYRDVLGPEDIAELDGTLYVVQASTGPLDEMDPNWPNGVYEVTADGSLKLVADLTAWILANPTGFTPGDANPRGEPFRILPGDGFLWVLEANRGEVLKVGLDGRVSRVADLSVDHPVLAGFALAPAGGVYVGDLTGAPHADGAAKIMQVTADGRVSDVWVNLTTVTGIMTDADGTLYAIEMATNNDPALGMQPGTGKLVVQTGADQAADVAIDLDYPIALRRGPDGAAYVAMPAYGANELAGVILRIDLTAARPMAPDRAALAEMRCPGAEQYAPGGATPFPIGGKATPAARTAAATAPASATTSVPTTGSAAVTIRDFAFDPATVTIAVGGAITWTNRDPVPHTATADDKSFDSGNLNPEQTFSHTFDAAGSHDYICIYHPSMKGTVVVQ